MLRRVSARQRVERTRRRRAVSVVVPALDEAERLPLLLADLAAQTRPAAEVLVVDGGSADATVAIADAAGARTIRAARRGIAPQRNQGAASSTGDLLVFVDADVRLPPGFLERLAGEMERRDLDAACPQYRPSSAIPAVRAFFAVMNGIFWATAPIAASGGGMLIAIRRDLFEHLGGFDPGYRFEDAQLLRRAGRAGRYRVVRTPAIVSDRRFRRDGVLRTIGTYAVIGVLVALGLFRAANAVGYGFGGYRPDSTATT